MGEHRCATGGRWRSEDHPEYLALFFHVVPGIELLSHFADAKIFGFKYLESEEQPRIVLENWLSG